MLCCHIGMRRGQVQTQLTSVICQASSLGINGFGSMKLREEEMKL